MKVGLLPYGIVVRSTSLLAPQPFVRSMEVDTSRGVDAGAAVGSKTLSDGKFVIGMALALDESARGSDRELAFRYAFSGMELPV